ncbi:MAG TPA: hypothetical protein VNI79_01410 [Sphingomicrobium sp.]|nr:hypothetical protein [Sphingomicrobium sp.]
MRKESTRPSIMDSPSARRAALAVGTLIAAVGAGLFLTKRKAGERDDPIISDAPS